MKPVKIIKQEYKSILVKNESNSKLTLFLYLKDDPICWLSFQSKIILPNNKYLHREKKKYKYELRAHIEENGKKTKKEVISATRWKGDIYIVVDEAFQVSTGQLDENHYDTRVCVRELNRSEAVNSGAGRNLYEILKLDPKEIRKMDDEEEIVDRIKAAFVKEMKYWHPDKHPDLETNDMVQELLFARKILLDPETRARYNNEMDYNKGWLSLARWKSIFWPECKTEEQKRAYKYRMIQMGVSVLTFAAGIIVTGLTAGIAAPAAVIVTSMVGGGLTGAGMNTTMRLMKKKSVLDGCSGKDLVKSAAIGFVAGAVTGGATAGLTAGVAGIGAQATVTTGKYVGIGAASASIGGAAFSVANDAEKKFVDNEDVTMKQVLGHAAAGVVIGAVTGGAVGAACGAVVNSLSGEVSAANIEGKVAKVVRRAGVSLAKNMTGNLTEQGTGAVLHGTAEFIEERLDEDCENKPVTDHVKNIAIDLATGVAKAGGMSCTAAIGDAIDDTEDFRIKPKRTSFYKRSSSLINQDAELRKDIELVMEQEHSDTDGLIKVLSEGLWKSRMHVQYIIDGIWKKITVVGNGESVIIPGKATCVHVTFEILRFIGVWCDLKKWDRKTKTWQKETHILRYPHAKGLHRTITISGPLYYECITKIVNEYYDEVDDN